MDDHFVSRDRTVPTQFVITATEIHDNYCIKVGTIQKRESIWVFRDGQLRGEFRQVDMLEAGEVQVVYLLPTARHPVRFFTWDAEKDSTDADYDMGLLHLVNKASAYDPSSGKPPLLFHGFVGIGLDETERVDVMFDNAHFLSFFSPEDGMALIDTGGIENWQCTPSHDYFMLERVNEVLTAIAMYLEDYLIMLLPEPGETIH